MPAENTLKSSEMANQRFRTPTVAELRQTLGLSDEWFAERGYHVRVSCFPN